MARSTAARTLLRSFNRVVGPLVQAGLGSPVPFTGGAVVLETTGRVTGAPRQVPLLAWHNGCSVYVSTVRDGSQWVHNLEADPTARVWLNGKAWDARSTLLRTPIGTVARLDPAA